MRAILEDLKTVPGVNGSFVCNDDGKVVERDLPGLFDDDLLDRVGGITTRVLTGLETAGEVGDLDFTFEDGRLIVKSFATGSLCILCEPSISASFLTLSAGVAVKKLSKELAGGGETARPSAGDELRSIVVRELGEHSGRALGILDQAGDSPEELAQACAAITRLTRLFISKSRSEEIDLRLQAALAVRKAEEDER